MALNPTQQPGIVGGGRSPELWAKDHRNYGLGSRNLGFTWTPKVCRIMAFMAVIRGLGLLFYILLGFG